MASDRSNEGQERHPGPRVVAPPGLTEALAVMAAGDTFAAATVLPGRCDDLGTALLECEPGLESALARGVQVRRLLAVPVVELELLEVLAHCARTGDVGGLPGRLGCLARHLQLAASEQHYEFRVLLPRREPPAMPLHLAFAQRPAARMRRVFVATAAAAGRVRLEPSADATLVERFDAAWRDAVDVRDLETGAAASRWLGELPTQALMAAVDTLSPAALERLQPALVAEWERRGLEGMPPFLPVVIG